MNNYEKISIKGFRKTTKRFSKIAKEYLNNLYSDVDVVDRIGNEFNYYVDNILNKMVETYKMSPNKKKSAHIHKVKVFKDVDFLREFKISYEFVDDNLIFKLLTRHQSWKYKRKINFVLPLKKTEKK